MTLFPERLPQSADAEGIAEAEARELILLAEELRDSCPDPAVGSEFADAVRTRLARPWTVWRTLERSAFARVAATLLVIVIGVAPVVALVRMLPWFRSDPPPIGFILPRAEPEIQELEPEPPAPGLPDEATLATADLAVQRDRLLRAAASWRSAGPGKPAAPAALRIQTWTSASAEELWQEFVRRCALADTQPVPAALAARVSELSWSGGAEARAALAPWLWVLGGDPYPLTQARAAHAWPGAPWLSGR